MAYLLRFDGIDDHCTFPTSLSINLGVDAYSFECRLALSSLPASSLYGIVGRLGTATGFSVTPDGRLAMYGSGSLRYQTSAGLFLTDSDLHTYRLEHDAGGAWRVYRDDLITPVESGIFTTSTIASNMNRIGTATSGSGWLAGGLAYVDLQIPVGSQKWDADLSGGTGAILPTVSGANQGSLVNFTIPDCWNFYGDGGTVTSTIAAGIPVPTASVSADVVAAAVIASINAGLPIPTASVSASAFAPTFTATISGGLPVPSAAISANAEAPIFSAVISGGLPIPTVSVSALVVGAGNSALINAGMPVPSASVSASVIAPIFSVSINAGLPVPIAAITATNELVLSAAISAGLPVPAASLDANVTLPDYMATITAGLPVPTASIQINSGVRVIILPPERLAALPALSFTAALPALSHVVALH